jgi:predicted enzyme related to lactoylglutathione lyase
MSEPEKLNYVELPARDLPATRAFFQAAFGWEFEEFGPDYCAFAGQGLDGGFYRSELYSNTQNGSALLVFYSDDLEATQASIEQAGGRIEKPVFDFPGGRRFHFSEPSGNEFAVWSAQAAAQADRQE